MDKKLFEELTQSIKEAGEFLRGKRKPVSEAHIEPPLQRYKGKGLLKAPTRERKRERDL